MFKRALPLLSLSLSVVRVRAMATATAGVAFTDLVPSLVASSDNRHKGQHGKVLIIGGSFAYTGAPFYAGISALKTGADLVYIACTEDAAIPIKSYSPELIVQPVLKSSRDVKDGPASAAAEEAVNKSFQALKPMIERVQSAIIGPGLGMDPLTHRVVERAIEELKRQGKPTVFDADSLSLIAAKPTLLCQHPAAILTPNAHEFSRLWESLHFHHPRGWEADNVPPVPHDPLVATGQLMALLQTICATYLEDSAPDTLDKLQASNQLPAYVAVLKKGSADVAAAVFYPEHKHPASESSAHVAADGSVSGAGGSSASEELVVYSVADQKGSPRRSGGQGDCLAGCLGTFLAWRHAKTSPYPSASFGATTPPPGSRGEGWFGSPYPSAAHRKPHPSIVTKASPGTAGGLLPVGAARIPREQLGSEEEYHSSTGTHVADATSAAGKGGAGPAPVAVEDAPARLQALVACGAAAAKLVRDAAEAAFAEHKRSTTTPDIIAKIGAVFDDSFPGTL